MFDELIGRSPQFQALIRTARAIAASDVSVLIVGETGTGKEILAQGLWRHSPRVERPYVAVNCSALPEFLVDAELFGYRKGAFTGAVSTHLGQLQAAYGGTLFLDEVHSLSLSVQAKLLRFLELGEIQPIGEASVERVDVRVIAATNVDLTEWIGKGGFRNDLYYRLNVVPLEIPPLRDRVGDVELLLDHFVTQFAHQYQRSRATFSRAAMARLCSYSWPGNVRELRNVCERLSILMAGCVIQECHLPEDVIRHIPHPALLFTLPEDGIELEQVGVELIRQALHRTNGNHTRSARLLGISRDTLLYRMKKHGIRAKRDLGAGEVGA